MTEPGTIDPDLAFLTDVQKDSFAYFVHEVNEANGLVADKTADHWPASIAAVGMALPSTPSAPNAAS
jgi:hypothetical protein